MSKSRSVILTVPPEVRPTLSELLALGPDFIGRFTDALETTGPSLDDPNLRATTICKNLNDDRLFDIVERILVEIIIPTINASSDYEFSSEHFMDAFSELYEVTEEEGPDSLLSQAERENWLKSRESLSRLIGSQTIALDIKARNLLNDRANRVKRVKIYSDVRPLFDEGGESVRAYVVTNSLRMQYMDGTRRRSESFAFDPAGLLDLKKQIDHALTKNRTLQTSNETRGILTLMVRSAPTVETKESQ